MKAFPNPRAGILKGTVSGIFGKGAEVLTGALVSHGKIDKVMAWTDKRNVKSKEGHTVLFGVHIAVSKARTRPSGRYYGVREELLQPSLDEFCYKSNGKDFGERIFDRLMPAAVCYKPMVQHRTYKINPLNSG